MWEPTESARIVLLAGGLSAWRRADITRNRSTTAALRTRGIYARLSRSPANRNRRHRKALSLPRADGAGGGGRLVSARRPRKRAAGNACRVESPRARQSWDFHTRKPRSDKLSAPTHRATSETEYSRFSERFRSERRSKPGASLRDYLESRHPPGWGKQFQQLHLEI